MNTLRLPTWLPQIRTYNERYLKSAPVRYYWQEDKYVSGSNYDYTKAETAKYVHKVIAQEANKAQEKYNELLMAVGNKYAGETRHETALRYIRSAERGNDNQATKSTEQE